MAAHLRKRGATFYLVDGEVRRSLKTDKKTLAEARLRQYLRQEFRFGPKVTVKGYYEKWIETKKPPITRPNCRSAYVSHFQAHVLGHFRSMPLRNLGTEQLSGFRNSMVQSGLSLKSARNVIDGSLRAMWRQAMIEGIVEHDPFKLVQWPRLPRLRPDPFTAGERDGILAWWESNDFYFYPYVYFQFHTGCRPSETHGLMWSDVDLERGLISISRSLVMGEQDATKTEHADRIITVDNRVQIGRAHV